MHVPGLDGTGLAILLLSLAFVRCAGPSTTHPVHGQAKSTFDPRRKSNVIGYWGQNTAGAHYSGDHRRWEKDLDAYCVGDTYDAIHVAFLTTFKGPGPKAYPLLNLANHCSDSFEEDPHLLRCPEVSKSIKYCQKQGKAILLSLGGSAGVYGFSSVAEVRQHRYVLGLKEIGGRVRPLAVEYVSRRHGEGCAATFW